MIEPSSADSRRLGARRQRRCTTVCHQARACTRVCLDMWVDSCNTGAARHTRRVWLGMLPTEAGRSWQLQQCAQHPRRPWAFRTLPARSGKNQDCSLDWRAEALELLEPAARSAHSAESNGPASRAGHCIGLDPRFDPVVDNGVPTRRAAPPPQQCLEPAVSPCGGSCL